MVSAAERRAWRAIAVNKTGTKMQRTETIRLFIAIPLPEEVKSQIEKTQNELRQAVPGKFIRWTKREHFHLTLKFLGNVEASLVAELTTVLRDACVHFTALRLRAERIGFFPDLRFPRVIWAWVHDENEILAKMQRVIESAVGNFSQENAEENFTGHVTLGRVKGIKRPQAEILAKLALGMTDRFFGEWAANRVELIRSELSANGSRYTTLAAIPLPCSNGVSTAPGNDVPTGRRRSQE
jgi:2'-5' RNA ligase